MTIRRVFTATTFVLYGALLPFSTCYAARIFNNMDFKITVGTNGGTNVDIQPHDKSESLNWTGTSSSEITVWGVDNRELCDINFSWRAEIQGGNYMIVTPVPGGTACVVCDSNHNRMYGEGECN